jgi:hypothetical protein
MTDNKSCQWVSEPDFPVVFIHQRVWKTTCENRYLFDHRGQPSASHFQFCPYCGKPIDEEELSDAEKVSYAKELIKQ